MPHAILTLQPSDTMHGVGRAYRHTQVHSPSVCGTLIRPLAAAGGSQRRTDTMLMHSSVSAAAADAEARFFFHAWNRPSWRHPPLPGSVEERVEADRLPNELCGQSALWQWEKDGWFFMVSIRDHIVDDMYAVGDAAQTVSACSAAGMIFESEWECPGVPGETLLAVHPFHPESYAPGVLLSITKREFEFKVPLLTVEFYDGLLADIPQDRCVALPEDLVDYDKLVDVRPDHYFDVF